MTTCFLPHYLGNQYEVNFRLTLKTSMVPRQGRGLRGGRGMYVQGVRDSNKQPLLFLTACGFIQQTKLLFFFSPPIRNTEKQIRSGLIKLCILIYDCNQPLFNLLFLFSWFLVSELLTCLLPVTTKDKWLVKKKMFYVPCNSKTRPNILPIQCKRGKRPV